MDRVQVVKQESAALGGNAADEQPWPEPIKPQEDAIETAGVFLQDGSNRDESCLVSRVGPDMTFKDGNNPTAVTLANLLESAGGGITEGQHKLLDSLVHNLSETSYEELTRSGGKVTDIIHWTDNGKTVKIREVNLTRTSGKVSTIVMKQYDGAGALAQTLTGTVTRSGGKVASIDWVES